MATVGEFDLTPTELRLMLKMAEANDQADGRRRVGSVRTRATLMAKLYAAVDALPTANQGDEDSGDGAD